MGGGSSSKSVKCSRRQTRSVVAGAVAVSASTLRSLYVLGIVALAVVLLFVILHLMGASLTRH